LGLRSHGFTVFRAKGPGFLSPVHRAGLGGGDDGSCGGAQGPARVSTSELFFDLVFVFTITQLTQLVGQAHAPLDFLRVLLVLTPISMALEPRPPGAVICLAGACVNLWGPR
jgi:hypothetical protein